jgi:hypothetical protein
MSDSAPRRPTPKAFAYLDYESGKEISDRQLIHLDALANAAEALREAMHYADGTTMPGEHQEHTWSSHRMSVANSHLETALFFARRAALESP